MDDRRLICVQEDHAFYNLPYDADPSAPGQRDLGFVKDVEKGCSMAIFANNVEVIVVLSHSNEGN